MDFNPVNPFTKTYKYNYLSSSISLRTTDESIIHNLLTKNVHQTNSVKPELHSIEVNEFNKEILANIKNILSINECTEIIKTSESLESFQNLNKSNKYDCNIRKSDRLLVLDDKLSNLLWNRLENIIKEDIIDKHNISTIPLGFGVINNINDNNWNISSINIAMRINRYNSNNNDFFTFHKDAQYALLSDVRSIFTLIIYLNDDFEGGETKFYLNKRNDKQMINTDCTISQEIEYFGGIKNGFECITMKPSIGDGIIFSHDIIHEGIKIKTPNKYKYIIKTDVVVKRKTFNGFAISTKESKDYERCLMYFSDAQKNELKGNKEKANELYERSLFIRYSYPKKLQNDNISMERTLSMNVEQIWLIIFDYCHIREMECISYLFPTLHKLIITWKLMYNHRYSMDTDIEDDELIEYGCSDALYIPSINTKSFMKSYSSYYNDYPKPKFIDRWGNYHIFEWDNYDFFNHYEYDCCRVAAVYAFYLMSHTENGGYFIAEYDAHSQNVVAVPLCKLLRDVFYHRQCHGAYFKINGADGTNKKQCFDNNIDRDYMSVVHNAQFVGGIGLINKFKRNCKPMDNNWDEINNTFSKNDDWWTHPYKSEQAFVNEVLTVYNMCSNPPLGYKSDSKGNATKDKAKYFEALISMKNSNAFGYGKMHIMEHQRKQSYCVCPIFTDNGCGADIQHYNQLVFDFSKNKLNVVKNNKMKDGCTVDDDNGECSSCLSLQEAIDNYVKLNTSNKSWLKLETLTYYTVNIESLFCCDNAYSMSFNHASCQCGKPSKMDTNICGYLGYHHLNHVHIATMKTENNKAMMWLSYNNIAAL